MSVHPPTLTYRQPRWERWDATSIAGDGPALYDALEISARIDHRFGTVTMSASGSMWRKDGLPGPNRSREIRLNDEQPDWLVEIIEDAHERLGVPRG